MRRRVRRRQLATLREDVVLGAILRRFLRSGQYVSFPNDPDQTHGPPELTLDGSVPITAVELRVVQETASQ